MAKIVDHYCAATKGYWMLDDNVRSQDMDAFVRLLEQRVTSGRELSHSDLRRHWNAVPKMEATGVVMHIVLFFDLLYETLRTMGIANENDTFDDHIAALYSLDDARVKENELLQTKVKEMEAQLSDCMEEIKKLKADNALLRENSNNFQNEIKDLKVELRKERADRIVENYKLKAVPEIAARVDFVRECILASVLKLDWVKSKYAKQVAAPGFYYPDLFKLAWKDDDLLAAIYTEANKQFGFKSPDWDVLSITFYRIRNGIHYMQESADQARILVAYLPEDFAKGRNYELVMELINKVEERRKAAK